MARQRRTSEPKPEASKKVTLKGALLEALRTCQSCGAIVTERSLKCSCGTKLKPRKAGDVVNQALEVWASPTGKTPKATASTALLNMERAGLLKKPEKGMVILTPAGAEA